MPNFALEKNDFLRNSKIEVPKKKRFYQLSLFRTSEKKQGVVKIIVFGYFPHLLRE